MEDTLGKNLDETTHEVITTVDEPKVEEPKVDDKTPMQHRVERAERQTEERLLEKLGVEKLDDVLARLERVEHLENELNTMKAEQVKTKKATTLKQRLEAENVFDAEALLYMVDLDELEDSDEEYDNVIKVLKEKKPKHFGVRGLVGDEHKSSKDIHVDPVRDKEAKGDYLGATSAWIKSIQSK